MSGGWGAAYLPGVNPDGPGFLLVSVRPKDRRNALVAMLAHVAEHRGFVDVAESGHETPSLATKLRDNALIVATLAEP